jgi:formate dehydrogenase subunit gamma
MASGLPGSLALSTVAADRDVVAPEVWVARFGRTERFTHWWIVLMVVVALVTGLAIGDESRSGVLLWLHIASVALIVVGLAVAALFGDRAALFGSARELFGFDVRDRAWLVARIRHPLQRHRHPRWGLFNTGQKVLAWALTVSLVSVVVTGIVSWRSGGEGGLHAPAIVVTVILLAAHVFMAVVNPSTRPALAGMVLGRVRRSWAATHHPAWLDDVDGRDGSS